MSVKKPDPYGVEGSEHRSKPEGVPDGGDDAAATDASPAGTATSRFTADVVAGVHVIRPSASMLLDAQEIEALGDDLYRHLKPVDAPRVVLDLERVEHMSSAALGMLVALRTVIEKKGGKICLAHVRDELKQIFKITKLHKVLKLHDDTARAVASLR